MKKVAPHIKFLIKNLVRGLLWLTLLLILYFLLKDVIVERTPEIWIEKFTGNPLIIYSIYVLSEFFFGIIPPEFFMLWVFNNGNHLYYFYNLLFFALSSYLLGYITFLIGKAVSRMVLFRYYRIRYLHRSWNLLRKYGLFLIIIAALTPVPWSATSMLVGSAGYPSVKFLKFGLFRIVRFALYGYIIFQTHHI